MSPDRASSTPPTKFGVFYPRGYVVVAFKGTGDAETARKVLIEGGYDPQDVFLSDASEVLKHTTAHLDGARGAAKMGGVVRRFQHAIAHKYDRFTLVELGR